MKTPKTFQNLLFLLCVSGTVIMMGCGVKAVRPESPMDTPDHHHLVGMNLYEKGEYQEALKEFERARALDPKYAPAHIGIGLTLAELNRFDEAFSSMEKARKLASLKTDKVAACSGMIRLYTKWQGNNWLEKAEENFFDARSIDKEDPAPIYYMALAYKTANEYEKASEYFKKVILLNKGYVEQADRGWESVQRIQRAMPETKIGQRIAGLNKITRADVAALFIHELRLEKLFKQGKSSAKEKSSTPGDMPTDYNNHILRADIDMVIHLGIRGLEPIGNRFDPDKEITRSNFAVMSEDILVKATGESDLPNKFIGSKSPFKDVDASNYAFNAIMTCTTRGIMKADLNGYFKGQEPVSGADALLILRRLKDAMN